MSYYYTEDHEWILLDGDIATIGISDYAQKQLGDVVYVELPDIGASFTKGDDAAVVESVKAASDVYAPIGGEITEVNHKLEDTPALVNDAPEVDGWFFKMKIADKSDLGAMMDADTYKAYCEGQG